MIAFVFPGQGSQKRGMGQGLFDEVSEYAAVEKDVDAILGLPLELHMTLDQREDRVVTAEADIAAAGLVIGTVSE